MRAAIGALVLLLACYVAGSGAGVKRESRGEGIKVNVDYLEKTYGIKYKSHKMDTANPSYPIIILLEFTKDVDHVDELRKALPKSGARMMNDGRVLFYCFDDENVSTGVIDTYIIQGELSGVKGDAFRLRVMPPNLQGLRKIEARPSERTKASKKAP